MAISKKDLKFLKLKQAEKIKRHFKTCAETNHALPITRRDFLAAGLLSFAGTTMLPSILQLAGSTAHAQMLDCQTSTGGLPVYINIQLAGGPALFANYLPQEGGMAPTTFNNGYTRLLGVGDVPQVQPLFANQATFWWSNNGANPELGESKMIRGLLEQCSGLAEFNEIVNQKSIFVGVASESLDDRNGSNPQDISGMIAASGLAGSSLPYLLSGNGKDFLNRDAIIRNRYKGAIVDSANYLIVKNLADLEANVGGMPGVLGNMLSLSQQQSLVASLEKLNTAQVTELVRQPASNHQLFSKLIQCASKKNTEAVNDNANVDFQSEGTLDAIWGQGLSAAEVSAGVPASFATVIERCGHVIGNAMRGLAGAAAVNLGGYDYHINFFNRQEANLKDYEFGAILGRTLKSAKALNKKCFIHITTDGSLSVPNSNSFTVNWAGDSPRKSLNYFIAYDPAGAPDTAGFTSGSYSDSRSQLNHFTADAIVDKSTALGGSTEVCAAAVFLNYLSFANSLDKINDPKLAAVKKILEDSLPSGVSSIYDFFTRIKPNA